jgi:hypothetical protein
MSSISFRELDPQDRYKLLCGVVVPRPIALVTTLDENGAVNLSSLTHSSSPKLKRLAKLLYFVLVTLRQVRSMAIHAGCLTSWRDLMACISRFGEQLHHRRACRSQH